MTVKARITAIRLAQRLAQHPGLAEKMGVTIRLNGPPAFL